MSTATKKAVSKPRGLSGDSPAAQWYARLTMSGKLLLFGGVAGVTVAFLPLVSVSSTMMEFPASAMVIDDLRGLVGVVGYLATVVLAVVLYPASGAPQRKHLWAAVGVGTALALVGVWLFLAALRTGHGLHFGDSGALRAGLGAVLNLLAASLVATGAIWKAREEQLV